MKPRRRLSWHSKAQFKRRISHVSNTIHKLSAWEVRRLKTLNSADLNYVRLVSNIRQRQSNIRQKFNWCVKRRIFHAPKIMHKLCLFTWSRQTSFFCTVDANAQRRKVKRCVTVHPEFLVNWGQDLTWRTRAVTLRDDKISRRREQTVITCLRLATK